jgi:hypothetical protein
MALTRNLWDQKKQFHAGDAQEESSSVEDARKVDRREAILDSESG